MGNKEPQQPQESHALASSNKLYGGRVAGKGFALGMEPSVMHL